MSRIGRRQLFTPVQLRPDRFIAFFYTGLGASLLLAGLLFGCSFAKAALSAKGKA